MQEHSFQQIIVICDLYFIKVLISMNVCFWKGTKEILFGENAEEECLLFEKDNMLYLAISTKNQI